MSPNSVAVGRPGAMSPAERSAGQRAMSPQSVVSAGDGGGGQRAISPTNRVVNGGGAPFALAAGGAALANSQSQPNGNGTSIPNGPARGKPPPVRPRRDDDPVYGVGERSEEGGSSAEGGRAASPAGLGDGGSSNAHVRAVSPTHGPSLGGSQQGRANGLSARSPSPIVTVPPPQDAFYYSNATNPPSTSGHGKSSPMLNGNHVGSRNSAGNVVAEMLRGKEQELETMKRRENWMKAALARASKAGFVWADGDLQESRVGSWHSRDEDDISSDLYGGSSEAVNRKVADVVIKMKREYSALQVRLTFFQETLSSD